MMKRILIISHNQLDATSKLPNILETQTHVRKMLDTSWLVITTETPEQFWTKMEPYLNKDVEKVFIGEIKGYQGWLSRTVWEWITETMK